MFHSGGTQDILRVEPGRLRSPSKYYIQVYTTVSEALRTRSRGRREAPIPATRRGGSRGARNRAEGRLGTEEVPSSVNSALRPAPPGRPGFDRIDRIRSMWGGQCHPVEYYYLPHCFALPPDAAALWSTLRHKWDDTTLLVLFPLAPAGRRGRMDPF